MRISEEYLKSELNEMRKKRAEVERIRKLEQEIEEEKRKLSELSPSFWERMFKR